MKNLKNAKKLCLLIVSIMILQLAMPLSFAGAEPMPGEEQGNEDVGEYGETTSGAAIQADGFEIQGGEPKDLKNIFEFEYLKLGDNEIKDDEIIVIAHGTKLALGFKWDTEGLDAKSGDYATIQLSNLFKDVTVNNQPITVSSSEEPVIVGYYSIISGELKFVFNEKIEDSEVKDGYVGLQLEFNLEKFMEDVEQEIKFNDSKGTTLNVIAKPSGTTTSISKKGNPDSTHDAKEITWTIDVVNGGESEITGAKVTDTLPAGLELQIGSFIITELTIGIDDSKNEGSTITKTPVITGNKFELNFEKIKPYKGYRIQYTTKITDYTKDTFTNAASFEYDGKTLPASSTVDKLTRSNPIEKDGKYLGNDVIEWTIDVNKSGNSIIGAKVEDDLPDELKFVSGSIEVYKITKNGDKWEEGSKLNGYSDIFPIELEDLTANDAYRIKFKTDIDYLKVNGGNYQKINELTNETELKNGENIVVGSAEKKVTVTRSSILRKTGASNVNYTNKTLTWTIHVNEAKHPITNAIVEDIIPAGLSIAKSDIKIYNASGTDITSTLGLSDITIEPYTGGANKVTINLGNINKEYRKIVYTTTITDFTKNEFNNSASLGGTGVGGGGTINPVPVNPPANSFGKSFKSIDYGAKTMSWEITADPVREAFNEFKIVDTFPNKGMILLPGTVEVKVGGTTLTKGTDYTLTANTVGVTTGYQKGFTIEFIAGGSTTVNLNNSIVVTYQTSYDRQFAVEGDFLDPHEGTGQDKVYKNKAQFIGKTVNGNTFDVPKDAEHTVREDSWNSGKKEGQLVHFDGTEKKSGWVSDSERKIAWQLYINYQKQNLETGVVVTDTLNYTGKIDENSIKVSVYNVKPDGKTEITGTVLPKDKYSLSFDLNYKKFTLTFNEAVSERYVIEYLTTVPDISQEKYTNNANVKVGVNNYPYSTTITYDNYNEFLSKGTVGLGSTDVYTGDEIDWEVKVNESLSVIKKDAQIVDTISKGLVYVDNSLKLYKLTSTGEEPLIAIRDYDLDKSVVDGKTTLTILFTGDVDYTVVIKYKTVVTEKSGQVYNNVEFTGTGIDRKTVESSKLNASQFSWVGGTYDPKKGRLEITKVDSEAKVTIDNNEAEFTLWYKLNGDYVQFGGEEAIKTVNGVLTIGNLPLRTYYLREVKAPTGYIKLDDEIEIVVDKAYNNNAANIKKVAVENTKIKTSITAIKIWQDGPAKPTILLTLYRQIGSGAKEIVNSVSLQPGITSHTWDNLDKTDMKGNEYTYTVDEADVPGYVKSIQVNGNIVTITNKFDIKKGDITAKKVWDGGSSPKPNIKLQLFKNGLAYQNSVTLVNGDTEYTWYELELNDKDGNSILYSVKEIEIGGSLVTEGETVKNYKYEGVTTVDGKFVITNTYVSPKTDITATKKWEKGPDEKPTIELQLYRQIEGGAKALVENSKVTLANGTISHTWTDLDETDKNGNAYTYTVDEVNVPTNYTKVADGLTVTNTYVSPKINVTGNKIWVGGPTPRPTIKLQLYRDGAELGEPVELKNGEASHTWENLNKTDENGKDYIYTIDEVATPENYGKSKSGDGLTITNTYKSPKDDITGRKVWVGGPKPSIQLQLYRQIESGNKEAVGSPVTLDSGVYKYTWKSQDKTDNDGNVYTYTVEEIGKPANYNKTEDGLTVTNTYVIPKTQVTATKEWENGPAAKPTIELQLYRDGHAFGEPVELKDGTLTYTWTDLNETDINGKKYVYTVDEVNVPDNYVKSIDGLKITNTYVIPKKNVTGRKVWDGGPKPAIQIQLYRDGVAFGEPVTLENEVTEYTWYDLNVTDINGNVYTYTVEEIGVPDNYTKTEEGLTVTNTYVIPKINITGTKEWVGGPSTKPAIQLQLYRDGAAYGEPVTLENGTTTYTWENLDETDYEGNEYVYTIDEVEVPRRYRKSISDDGLTIRNRYNPPTRPTDPEEPEEPKEPEEPENPEVPEEPEIPEKPDKPDKPEEPKTPTEPEKPVVDSKDKLGNILINKLDLDSNPIEGAEFTLYDQSGRAIKTVTSDVNGTVLFSNLPLGLYTVIETKAPDGYEIFSDDLLVDFREAKTLKYNFRNAPEGIEIDNPDVPLGWEPIDDPDVPTGTIDPELPDTGSLFNTWLLAAIGFVLILAGLFIKRRSILN